MTARILVVDDDPFGRRYLEATLADAGYATVAAADGLAAWEAFRTATLAFDVVVTDVRMPGLSGLELIGRIREGDHRVAVIAVSALGSDAQVVSGLEAGADDYLTKPVSAKILVAKIRIALRRAEPGLGGGLEPLEAAGLTLDSEAQTVRRGDVLVTLTRTELAVVEYLMRNAGRIVSPAQILTSVWGEAYEFESDVLRTAIKRIRRKLGDDPRRPAVLRTHIGLGYSIGLNPD